MRLHDAGARRGLRRRSSGGEACSHYSGTTRVTAPLAHVELSSPAQSSCLMDDEVGQAALLGPTLPVL